VLGHITSNTNITSYCMMMMEGCESHNEGYSHYTISIPQPISFKKEDVPIMKKLGKILLVLGLTLLFAVPVFAQRTAAPAEVAPIEAAAPRDVLAPSEMVSITILHTNDFHGHLEPDYRGRGGSAYIATAINQVRDKFGEDNVALLDAGDISLGAPPISQLVLGESAIEIYNMLGYDVAAFGNHEFDLGKEALITQTQWSDFPWVGANIVFSGTDYEHPDWVKPYVTMTVGSPNAVTLGIIGVDTDETPEITVKGSTEGLEFTGLTEAISHYYDEVEAQSDVVIVLAHMGTEDSGRFKGLKTVAQELIDAGKPVDLMIGGHQHEPLYEPLMVGDTPIIEAGYYGHWVGQADLVVDTDAKSLSISNYDLITITTEAFTPTAVISDRVAYWAGQIVTQTQKPVGSTYISLTRDYNDESIMGDLVTDGMLWYTDQIDDGEVNDSVDIAFTNPGGLRANIEVTGTLPYTITWGETFEVMPFGNTLFLMDLTGAQIKTLLDQAASLYKGILQSSGVTWDWYNNDANAEEPNPTAWGAYNIKVNGEPIDPDKVYRVVTNNFLAGGQDGWVTFAEGTNRYDTGYSLQQGVSDYIGAISPIQSSDIEMDRITKRDIIVEPQMLSEELAAGAMTSDTLTISNMGEVTRTWWLTDVLAQDWLTLSQISGTLVPEPVEITDTIIMMPDSIDVFVGFDATSLEEGTYTTTLQLTSDQPEADPVDIPVELTVKTYRIYLPLVVKGYTGTVFLP
jgi:5'-nucleotidase / UDP-sugar diphosphatase